MLFSNLHKAASCLWCLAVFLYYQRRICRTSRCEWDVTMETIAYCSECVNIKPCSAAAPLSEPLLHKMNQPLTANQNPDPVSAVMRLRGNCKALPHYFLHSVLKHGFFPFQRNIHSSMWSFLRYEKKEKKSYGTYSLLESAFHCCTDLQIADVSAPQLLSARGKIRCSRVGITIRRDYTLTGVWKVQLHYREKYHMATCGIILHYVHTPFTKSDLSSSRVPILLHTHIHTYTWSSWISNTSKIQQGRAENNQTICFFSVTQNLNMFLLTKDAIDACC